MTLIQHTPGSQRVPASILAPQMTPSNVFGWVIAGPDPVAVDVETTGLHPVDDHLLEVGAVLLTRGLDFVSSFGSRVLAANERQLNRMVPYVRDMHTRNGLIDEVRESTLTLDDLETEMLDWLADQGYTKPSGRHRSDLIVLGSSCRLDLYMIEMKMPRLADMLSYRMADVSGMREMLSMWGPMLVPVWEDRTSAERERTPPTTHRALADTFTTIEEARLLRHNIVRAQPTA